MTNEKRQALNVRASSNPRNFVLLHLRPDRPGGQPAHFGALKLRSLNEILEFVVAGIAGSPEYPVQVDPGFGEVTDNPPRTLDIHLDGDIPPGEALQIDYRGHDYAVGDSAWDREAFKLLYRLFQMTVTDVSGVGLPMITIASSERKVMGNQKLSFCLLCFYNVL